VHIRLVAATNRDLLKGIEDEEFREDLYYRLNVIHITIPPLHERPEDIPPLIEHFLAKYNAELNTRCPGFTPDAMEAVLRRPWRGNVRELENVVERALIFADGEPVSVEDLCLSAAPLGEDRPVRMDLRGATREFETRHVARVLKTVNGNKADAARLLGIGLSSLYRKLDELEIRNGAAAASAG
jgi:DNA-binding NtrC family response regulator